MTPADWVEHRRSSDREVVGYIAFGDDEVVPMSLLGVPLAGHGDGSEQKVVIVELDRERVVVANAGFALVVGAPRDIGDRVELTVPTDRLRPA